VIVAGCNRIGHSWDEHRLPGLGRQPSARRPGAPATPGSAQMSLGCCVICRIPRGSGGISCFSAQGRLGRLCQPSQLLGLPHIVELFLR
jgi:hypothetical protein